MLCYPIIFLQQLRLSTSNLARSISLARPIIKLHAVKRAGVGLDQGSSQKFGVSTSILTQWLKLGTLNLVHCLGLPRPTTKPQAEEKWRGLELGKLPNIRSSPLIFLQRPRCSLSLSGASC